MPNEINRPRTRTRHAITLVPYEPDTIVVEIDHDPEPIIAPTVRIPRVTMRQLVFGEPAVGIRAFTDDDTAPHDLTAIEPLLRRCRPSHERFEKRARDLEARFALTVGDAADPDHVRVVARAARDRVEAMTVLGRVK